LTEHIETEIKRFGRNGRPFSVLLLDLDGLKKINDSHGHVVGSLALCRMAEVLYLTCRDIDTPARYGGDEFALVLPETSSEYAHRVANRIAQRLAEDLEVPQLTVSIGVAEYPRDGLTLESLLSAADRALYQAKRSSASTRIAAPTSEPA
jgi:diguanylate cyclase (GGDEF)-like protein